MGDTADQARHDNAPLPAHLAAHLPWDSVADEEPGEVDRAIAAAGQEDGPSDGAEDLRAEESVVRGAHPTELQPSFVAAEAAPMAGATAEPEPDGMAVGAVLSIPVAAELMGETNVPQDGPTDPVMPLEAEAAVEEQADLSSNLIVEEQAAVDWQPSPPTAVGAASAAGTMHVAETAQMAETVEPAAEAAPTTVSPATVVASAPEMLHDSLPLSEPAVEESPIVPPALLVRDHIVRVPVLPLEPAALSPFDQVEIDEPAYLPYVPYVPPEIDLGPAEEDEEEGMAVASSGGGWTIPLLCAGIAIIACCVLIPQADENRRLTYEREKLKQDLEYVQRQVAINDEFLKKVANDPTLAERLAQRQMKVIRQGTEVLSIKGENPRQEMSPFLLVNVSPPPPMPAYRPIGGKLAAICRDPKQRLYLMGGALLLIACGLILGGSRRAPDA